MVTIKQQDWDILKEKFRRKYNHLSDDDLAFEAGNEEDLIRRLANRVKRDQRYIQFTLMKELANLKGNAL